MAGEHLEPKVGWFDHDRPLKAILNAGIRLRAKIHGEESVAAELKALLTHFATAAADGTASKLISDALNDTEH